MYDNLISIYSFIICYMLLVESFFEFFLEFEEIGFDDFVFDIESLNESIREVSCFFGVDEEF